MARPSHSNSVTAAAATVCALCAVYTTLTSTPPPAGAPPPPADAPPPRAEDRWEGECGARFVDDLWNGYARTYVRTRRERERRECVWVAREEAMLSAERAAALELRSASAGRYPARELPATAVPLTAAEAREVEAFWDAHPEPARLLQDLGLASAYPDPPPDNHEHWKAQVVARDMMRDAKALMTARQRARAVADTSACALAPERREDVERAFDDVVWRLFGAGDPCARMYIGFGNDEVARLFHTVVHGS